MVSLALIGTVAMGVGTAASIGSSAAAAGDQAAATKQARQDRADYYQQGRRDVIDYSNRAVGTMNPYVRQGRPQDDRLAVLTGARTPVQLGAQPTRAQFATAGERPQRKQFATQREFNRALRDWQKKSQTDERGFRQALGGWKDDVRQAAKAQGLDLSGSGRAALSQFAADNDARTAQYQSADTNPINSLDAPGALNALPNWENYKDSRGLDPNLQMSSLLTPLSADEFGRSIGYQGQNYLGDMLRMPTQEDFLASPDYEFRRGEGMRGIESSAAAGGGLLSSSTLKALNRFNSNLASGEWGNFTNRFTQNQDRNLGELARTRDYRTDMQNRVMADYYGQAGLTGQQQDRAFNQMNTLGSRGQSAATVQAGVLQNTGNSLMNLSNQTGSGMADYSLAAGQQRADAAMNIGNSISRGAEGAFNAYLYGQAMSGNGQRMNQGLYQPYGV